MDRFRKVLFFLLRQLLYSSLFLFTLLLLCLYTLRFPVIQNKILPYVKAELESALHTRVEIGSVEIALWDYLVIRDFVMYDTRGEKFIAAGTLKISLIKTSLPGWLGAVGTQKYLTIRDLELEDGYFNLYRRTHDLKLNMYFLSGESTDTTETGYPDMNIRVDNLLLYNASFNYIDSAKGKERLAENGHLNFIHLMLDSIYGDLSFELKPRGNIESHIRTLSARDTWSGFVLDTFRTHLTAGLEVIDQEYKIYNSAKNAFEPYFCYEETPFVFLNETLVKSMGSRIHADFKLPRNSLGELLDAELQEDWLVHLKPSIVDFRFVNSFSSYKLPFFKPLRVDGKISGVLNRLKGKDLNIFLEDSTFVQAQVSFVDLVDEGETQMELKIRDSRFLATEVQSFIPDIPLPEFLKNARDARMEGSFTGFFNDFVVRADIKSPEGNARTDLHIDLKSPLIAWSGTIESREFDLNQILGGNPGISSRLNVNAEFKGVGDSPQNLDASLNLSVVKSELGGYEIDTISTQLRFENKILSGPLDIRDAELGSVHTQNSIHFSDGTPKYDILGDFDHINFQALGLSNMPVELSTVLNLHFEGDSLENLQGVSRMFDSRLIKNNTDSIEIERLQVRLELEKNGGKNIKLRSEKISADLTTDRSFTRSMQEIQRLGHEAFLFFNNNDSLTQAYYQQKKPDTLATGFTLKVHTQETQDILDFFETDLNIAPGTDVFLSLKTGNTDIVEFNVESGFMSYGEITLTQNQVEGNIFKDASNGEILAQADIFSKDVHFTPELNFQNVSLEPIWFNETIEFELKARQDSFKNQIRIFGQTIFKDRTIKTLIGSNNSTLLLNNDLWTFAGKNEVIYYSESGVIQLNDIHLIDSTRQSLHIYGDITHEAGEGLVVKLENVKLATLNQLAGTGEEIEGLVNAQIMLNDLFTDPFIQGFAFVKNFGFRKLQYGDIEANAVWNKTSKILSLDASLQKDGTKLFAITGHYATEDEDSPMNFKLATYNLPLELAEPFMGGYVYDVSGTVELNEFTVKGTLLKPVITGNGYFKDVTFIVDYTKTKYNFTGNIRFNDRNINFLNIRIFDEQGLANKQNYANLSGYIYHQGFRDFKFNIELESIRNFMVFNTKEEDNDLFYGKMIIRDGVASIDGDLNTIRLTTFVETGAGTVLNIPLTDYTEGSDLDYVTFLSDTVETLIQEKLDLTGFELKITVNATPDATVRIIFDERTGEIIEAQGNGNIDLAVTPEGEFTMRGNYEIEKGEYLFTLQNGTFNKRFFIEKGGRITWTGSPYDAQINLNAYYLVYANISDLMGPTSSGARVPVRVLMKMQGSLLSPEIALNLDVQNINDQSSAEVTSRLKAITSDPQQLNNQVFFLLMSSRFAPNTQNQAAGGAGSGSSGVTSSVAELVSNQLNYWTSQAFGNNFSANISSNQFQNINLALQAKLFNDRVTVERNGAITSSANNDVTIGNINVQLKLLPSNSNRENSRQKKKSANPGMLSLEAFNREQFGFSGNNSVSRGGGLFYRKEFDRFNELFFPRRKISTSPPPPDSSQHLLPDSVK